MFSFPRKFGYKLFSHYCTQGVIGINYFPVNKIKNKKVVKKGLFLKLFSRTVNCLSIFVHPTKKAF